MAEYTITLSQLENLGTITEVENLLTEAGAAFTKESFKNEYTLIFTDLKGHFGYSVLVFNAENKHLRYCDTYELHYSYLNGDREKIKAAFLETLKNKIFSISELLTPDFEYRSQQNKEYFIRNYYYANCDYLSAFCIVGSKDEKELDEKLANGSYTYDKLSFCYITDPEKVKKHFELYNKMKKCFVSDNYDYWFTAFKYEMFNHEYAINYQGDWDVCSCFSKKALPYTENTERMLSYTDFTETQKKAYRDAKSYVLAHSNY